MLQFIKYRARYWFKAFCRAVLGLCPACGSRINVTPSGTYICPNCKAR